MHAENWNRDARRKKYDVRAATLYQSNNSKNCYVGSRLRSNIYVLSSENYVGIFTDDRWRGQFALVEYFHDTGGILEGPPTATLHPFCLLRYGIVSTRLICRTSAVSVCNRNKREWRGKGQKCVRDACHVPPMLPFTWEYICRQGREGGGRRCNQGDMCSRWSNHFLPHRSDKFPSRSIPRYHLFFSSSFSLPFFFLSPSLATRFFALFPTSPTAAF